MLRDFFLHYGANVRFRDLEISHWRISSEPLFDHILPNLKKHPQIHYVPDYFTWQERGVLRRFNQKEFVSSWVLWPDGLAEYGWVYWPQKCADGSR